MWLLFFRAADSLTLRTLDFEVEASFLSSFADALFLEVGAFLLNGVCAARPWQCSSLRLLLVG